MVNFQLDCKENDYVTTILDSLEENYSELRGSKDKLNADILAAANWLGKMAKTCNVKVEMVHNDDIDTMIDTDDHCIQINESFDLIIDGERYTTIDGERFGEVDFKDPDGPRWWDEYSFECVKVLESFIEGYGCEFTKVCVTQEQIDELMGSIN